MPCVLKVRIIAARNLPVMDRATELTDAFVELRFSDYDHLRTQIAKRTLDPVWNEDFRFEVTDDAELQKEPLEIRVMDYDQISYHDSIGHLFIDLNALLTWDSNSQIMGWFPIYDTLSGIRGELHVSVKLALFGDINPFKDSSAGVQFYTIPSIPSTPTSTVPTLLGFVAALDNEDDPEYSWSDSFRSPQTSNEERTRVLFKLSGNIRRQLGIKVIELGGNAVVGFKQFFDFEAEKRTITVRAIGTAIRLSSLAVAAETLNDTTLNLIQETPTLADEKDPPNVTDVTDDVAGTLPLTDAATADVAGPSRGSGNHLSALSPPSYMDSTTPISSPILPPVNLGLMSSDTEGFRDPPSLMSFNPKDLPITTAGALQFGKPVEPVLLTMTTFPPECIVATGGMVSATSVKIIENDDRDVRESWWTELRDEIKTHAKTLNCSHVIGYSESAAIHEELVILHVTGTAAQMDFSIFSENSILISSTNVLLSSSDAPAAFFSPKERRDAFTRTKTQFGSMIQSVSAEDLKLTSSPMSVGRLSRMPSVRDVLSNRTSGRSKNRKYGPACQSCHITYNRSEGPFPMSFSKCAVCCRHHVPEILLSTIQPPEGLDVLGGGILIEAHVCRHRKTKVGESRPSIISESIPFAQYDIHRQLMYKLRIQGYNAVFGLKFQVQVGESLLTMVATGTAMYVRALPSPPALKVFRNLEVLDEEDERLLDIQSKIMHLSEENRRRIETALATRVNQEVTQKVVEETDQVGSPAITSIKTGSNREKLPFTPDTDEDSSDDEEEGGVNGDDDALQLPYCGAAARQLQKSVVVQIDDEQDEDLILLQDTKLTDDFSITSIGLRNEIEALATGSDKRISCQMVSLVKIGHINEVSHHPNRQFSAIFKSAYQDLNYHLSYLSPCILTGLDHDVQLHKDNEVQISLTAIAFGPAYTDSRVSVSEGIDQLRSSAESPTPALEGLTSGDAPLDEKMLNQLIMNEFFSSNEELANPRYNWFKLKPMTSMMSGAQLSRPFFSTSANDVALSRETSTMNVNGYDGSIDEISEEVSGSRELNTPREGEDDEREGGEKSDGSVPTSSADAMRSPGTWDPNILGGQGTGGLEQSVGMYRNVEISPLSYIPNCRIERHLGRISLHFIKEANLPYEPLIANSGIGGFTHTFLVELNAIIRAHTAALGGNAIISFTADQSMVNESIKNQCYALISISGDVVNVMSTNI